MNKKFKDYTIFFKIFTIKCVCRSWRLVNLDNTVGTLGYIGRRIGVGP